MFVTDPISVETFTNFTCRSTICYENITNSSMCDTSFIHKGHPLTPDPVSVVVVVVVVTGNPG